VPTGANFNLGKTGYTAGGAYQFLLPVGPYFVAGVLADVAASNSSASTDFTTVHPDAFPSSATAESFSVRVRQGTNGSFRFKGGVPVNTFWGATLVYFTAGVVVSRIDIDYSYAASSVPTFGSCANAFFASCATNSFGNFSSHKVRTGFAGGGGVDIKVPGVGPGAVLTLDYTINAFGSYSETATINTVTLNGSPCIPNSSVSCTATDTLRIKSQVYHKPTIGIRWAL
jgi:hypothetical protein